MAVGKQLMLDTPSTFNKYPDEHLNMNQVPVNGVYIDRPPWEWWADGPVSQLYDSMAIYMESCC